MATATAASRRRSDPSVGIELRQVAVRDLGFDPVLQRPQVTTWVAELATNWDDTKVGVLIAADLGSNRASGITGGRTSLHLEDGLQRASAKGLKLLGEKPNPNYDPDYEFNVVVELGLSDVEIARRFLSYNDDTRAVDAVAKYTVGVSAEDPIWLAVKAALDDQGLSVARVASKTEIKAAAALRRIVLDAKRNADTKDDDLATDFATAVLAQTFEVTTKAFTWDADYGPTRWDADILQGIAQVLYRHSDKLMNGTGRKARNALIKSMRERYIKVPVVTKDTADRSGGTRSVSFHGAALLKRTAIEQRLSDGGSASRAFDVAAVLAADYAAHTGVSLTASDSDLVEVEDDDEEG